MKHVFETDADNATINPLYVQKNTSSVETTTTEIIKDYTSRGILPVPYGNEQKSVVEPLADDAPVTEWMARRPFLMGQAAGAIDNVLPAKDIVHEMVSTAVEHLNMASKYVVSKM